MPHSALLAFIAALTCAALPALAEILPPLGPYEAQQWQAIGVVNREGPEGPGTCSGTLIAPDLVLTAAHCAPAPNSQRQFILNGIGGPATVAFSVARAEQHPEYGTAEGMDRFAVDVALLTLASPVPEELATPLTGLHPDAAVVYGIVAYHRLRPDAPNGRFDCQRVLLESEGFYLGCQVIAGNSGAPALVMTPEGPRVAGVVTARVDRGPIHLALVAPLDTWLIDRIAAHQP